MTDVLAWRVLIPAAAAAFWLATGGPARATASLGCEIQDGPVSFNAEGAMGHGAGDSIVSLRAELRVTNPAGTPGFDFTTEHLTQRWARNREIRLRFYREGPEGSADLTILARSADQDDPDYTGTYVLDMNVTGPSGVGSRTLAFKGVASCSLG